MSELEKAQATEEVVAAQEAEVANQDVAAEQAEPAVEEVAVPQAQAEEDVYKRQHQHGHIGAALIGQKMEGTFLALHVSGGTTDLLQVTVEEGIIREILALGGTQDIAAGQLIDRVGQALCLPFPSGPKLTELAQEGEAKAIRSYVKGLSVSFSGAETAAKRFLQQGMPAEDAAASVLKCIGKTLRCV